jgi:hypothetical protein
MTFQINPLPKSEFEGLFELPDDALARHKAFRVKADTSPGFPCRVSLAEAEIGEELILLNYQHLDGDTPYAASHAIYVRRDVEEAWPEPGVVPDVLARRLLSVRGFNAQKLIAVADIVEGADLKAKLDEMFEDPEIIFIDVHNAMRGCFAAKATRA